MPQPDEYDESTALDVHMDEESGWLHIDCGPKPFAKFKQFLALELADHDLALDQIHSIEITEYDLNPEPEPNGFWDYLGCGVAGIIGLFVAASLGVGIYVTGNWLIEFVLDLTKNWQN
jgi:hypothetical protein